MAIPSHDNGRIYTCPKRLRTTGSDSLPLGNNGIGAQVLMRHARRQRLGGGQAAIDKYGENSIKPPCRPLVAMLAGFAFLAVTVTPAARAADDLALARARKCMNCHALAEKLVGPAYKDVATRYANDPQAEERLAKKIREGGSGAWGVVPMPSNDVTQAEARQLAHWVLMQK